MEQITKKLPFDSLEVVEAEHKAGGLVFFWKSNIEWKVTFKSKWVIGLVSSLSNGKQCYCWFCYCPAERSLKQAFWLDLLEIVKSGSEIWMCMGDFNDVVC